MNIFKIFLRATFVATLLLVCSHSASVPADGDAGPAPLPPQNPTGSESESSSIKPEPDVAAPVNTTQPKLNDYQESSSKIAIHNNHPESKVTITVGEDNGFQYTVNGHTRSLERIALSGEYFNDEYHRDGYVRLFLVAEPTIEYYAVRAVGNRLDVYAQNYYYDEFNYAVYCPYPVRGEYLRYGQVNATAILITGPSRSAINGRRSEKFSSLVTPKKP